MQGCASDAANSALGNSVGVDLSDGSTLNMEFDVFDASIAQANYNQYFWIRTNTDYGAWSNYCFAYSNWAYYSPWPYHGNIAGDNSTISDNWCPDLIFAKDQSVKISYTAPTDEKTGSFIVYTKHIEGTEWNELCYVKDIPVENVTDTKNVFMGIEIENASCWFKFMNFRMYVNDYEYDIPAIGLNGYLTETENTYVKPVTWQDGREYNIRVNTDAGVDAGGQFSMWFGNGVGVDLDEGESLTWEFTIDSVEYGLWYNCWGGIMVNSGAFPSVDPFTNTIANGVGWYSNFALNTSDYNGRTATVNGGSKGSATFATGYNVFDPYTDVTGTYTSGIAPIMIKVVYTSYDKTNNVPGSIVYYKKLKSEGSWTKVTEVTGITAELYDSMHISLFYSSSQNAGGAWDFDISNFTYYTSGNKSMVPVISVGGDGVASASAPTYTVTFMNGSETHSTQKVEEGNLATAESLAGYTPALGGMYAWVDEDGNVFDFETSIDADITLYLAQIADPAVKDATWQLTAESKSWLATLGTSVSMDLSDGSTATMEFDVVEGLPNANYDAGFYIWGSLPDYSTDNGYFSAFADNRFLGNSAYTTDSPSYVGTWNTEDYSATGFTFGEKFRPHEIFATGKTVKAVYTAPTASTTGSIIIYTKAIGAEDSEYAEQASIRNLTTAMVCNTSKVYFGFGFRQGANMGSDLDMTIENYHIYTADGDVPALYDYNQMVVTNKSVSEELPDSAYTGADTIGNTYAIGYTEGTTTASGWFGSTDGVTLAEDEVLTMEFEVLAAGNKWQNANSGFTVCNIDPSTQTTSPQNFYNLSGVTSFSMYGNWAFDTTTYENRTARLLGASGATISGIWDPYTDVAAGDWVKVEYKANSANSAGYLRVYTKVGANGTYVMNCSIEGITLDLDTDVRLVWFVSSSASGTNFTHYYELQNVYLKRNCIDQHR